MEVFNIQILKDRQDSIDAGHSSNARDVATAHGDDPFVRISGPKLLGVTTANCTTVGCGDIAFHVRTPGRGEEVMCRNCMNAIRRLSLVHDHLKNRICLVCVLDYGSLGDLTAAMHTDQIPITDYVGRVKAADGTIMHERAVLPGLESRVANGLVSIEDANDEVVIHELSHSSSEHCEACQPIRHPDCMRAGLCGNCIPCTPITPVRVLS